MSALPLELAMQANSNHATPKGWLYYKISILNPNPDYWATQLRMQLDLTDNFIAETLQFTLDGKTWLAYNLSLDIDDLSPLDGGDIIIKGKLKPITPIGQISYIAKVDVVFCSDVESDAES